MRTVTRRDLRDDQGSIMLAIVGIFILTMVASVGLAAVANGQKQARHDNTFAVALHNANSALDVMVAKIKDLPGSATSQTLPNTTLYKNVTATPVLNPDDTGNPGSTSWSLSATGISTTQKNTIYRIVEETVTIAHAYRTPVYGAQGLALGQGSGVTQYNPGTYTSDPNQISTGLTGIGQLIGAGSVTVPTPNNGTPGAATVGDCPTGAATCLQVAGADAQNFAQIAQVDPNDACGTQPEARQDRPATPRPSSAPRPRHRRSPRPATAHLTSDSTATRWCRSRPQVCSSASMSSPTTRCRARPTCAAR